MPIIFGEFANMLEGVREGMQEGIIQTILIILLYGEFHR